MTISSPASDHTLSSTEHAVLGVLAEGPAHGFAVARELAPGTDLGRILTVRRPLVYRALDRLIEAGFAEAVTIEPGDAGPRRTVLQVTRWGRRRLDGWLAQPVEHVRDIRIDFLLKISLIVRSGGDPGPAVDIAGDTAGTGGANLR
jgi:DNA-binding PadR family transcriptional regulator